MNKQGPVIPHEHGAWAMVSVPFLFGTIASRPSWMHVPLFLAWLFLYLSSYPFLQAVKRKADKKRWVRWGAIYGAIAAGCLIPPLMEEPALFYFAFPFLALLLVNLWHTRQRSERALLNDLCAILIFSLGGAGAYVMGAGEWNQETTVIVLLSFLYFAGTAFFVKSVFRERKNRRWAVYARVYHLLLLLIPWGIGYPYLTFAYVFPAARAVALAGRSMRPMKVGILEIAGAVQFLLLAVLLFD